MRLSQAKLYVPMTAAVVGLAVLVAKLFHWPVEKAIYFAPIIVVCIGLLAFLAILWVRIGWNEWQRVKKKRRWVVLTVVFVVLLVVLTVLGVKLPKYE